MKTFIDGKPVSVRTTLPYQLYTIALNAHDNKETIGITGDLKRHGQRWILENPRDLVVIPEDDDASPT